MILGCYSAVSADQRKFQWLTMFCLYTLPLARPAEAKIQMLKAICSIVKLIPWNEVNLSHLYFVSFKKLGDFRFFWPSQNIWTLMYKGQKCSVSEMTWPKERVQIRHMVLNSMRYDFWPNLTLSQIYLVDRWGKISNSISITGSLVPAECK
jgi:hypothetical protein